MYNVEIRFTHLNGLDFCCLNWPKSLPLPVPFSSSLIGLVLFTSDIAMIRTRQKHTAISEKGYQWIIAAC